MPRSDNPLFGKLIDLAGARSSQADDEPERDPGAAAEAEARRQRSIAILTREGVPINGHLPTIEAEAEAHCRTTEEAALRAIALAIVAVKGESLDHALAQDLVERYGIRDALTPKERAFIDDPKPSEVDRTQFVWRYECLGVMLWALGFADELQRPDRIVDVPNAVRRVADLGRDRFVAQAALRPARELLDAADLIYRYHWATREAELRGREPPAGLNPDVVMERHHALNWLIGYRECDWDEVSTDT